jgi:hypothetical protein
MLGGKRAAVLAVWALTVAAAFAVGRSTTPPESDPVPQPLAAAIEAALAEPDVLERATRTALLLQQLGPENVSEVAEVYDRMLNMLGEPSIRPFVSAWARFDPEGALKHTRRWPYPPKKDIGAGTAIEAWAMRDPTAALEAFESMRIRDSELEERLIIDMIGGWVLSGRDGVGDYVATLPSGRIDSAITRVTGKTLRHGGTEAAIAWVDSVTRNDAYPSRFPKKAFQRASRMVARWDPERAAEWVLENRGQPYASQGPRIVAEQWGLKDGRAALEWVRNHPDQEVHYLAARSAFLGWLKSDRDAAVEWLKSEEHTAFHDPAIVEYGKELAKREPAEAIGWCERALDEKQRLHCFRVAAALWYQRDAIAAEAWLQDSPLDEKARSAVRKPPRKRPVLRALEESGGAKGAAAEGS